MQKRLFALMFALFVFAAANALPLFAQGSEAIVVDVPFSFSVNGKTLPAGKYRIGRANDNPATWSLESSDNQSASFLLAMNLGGSSNENRQVTFRKYGSVYFLAGFKTPSYQVDLPVSKAEKVLQLASVPMEHMEVMAIETAYRGSR